MKEVQKERLFLEQLPELARFTEPAIEPGLGTDVALATTSLPIHLLSTPESIEAARAYRHIIGSDLTRFRISVDESPIERAMTEPSKEEIKLVIHSATDPILNRRMFADGPEFGQLLMGNVYVPSDNHESANVHCVGATKHSLDMLSQTSTQQGDIIEEITKRRKDLLEGTLSNEDFRRILRSGGVHKVIAHALGPIGTNISQAMQQYIEKLGITDKSELIIHNGVEPMQYAQMAAEQIEPGVIPIHMECAVYYQMADLFNQRPHEVVFADHHDMLLDTMQLASAQPLEKVARNGAMRIATHPSPRPLIDPWVQKGRAEWVKATSNAAAAQMALDPKQELAACITTASGLSNAEGLTSRHVFGRPNMLFTIATPLSQAQLQEYL